MKFLFAFFIGLLLCNLTLGQNIKYPSTKKVNVSDVYHGVSVEDPYRWLEDDKSAETAAWVKEQNKVTNSYLSNISFKTKIEERLNKLWNYRKQGTPFFAGGSWYTFKNDGLQNQSVLFSMSSSRDTVGKVILDPNTLSLDGTTSLTHYVPSKHGKYMAVGVANAGSDWRNISVKDLKTGKMLEDRVDRVKFSSVAWHHDGFYYSKYDATEGSDLTTKNEYHKVYYHKVGTKQEQDSLVFEDKEHAQRNFYVGTSRDRRFLVKYSSESTSGNTLHTMDLINPERVWVPIADNFENDWSVIEFTDDFAWILTNYKAPKKQIVVMNVNEPDEKDWLKVVPESDDVIRSVNYCDGKLVVHYIKDAHSVLKVYQGGGQHLYDIELPGLGTVGSFSGDAEQSEAFYSFTSFTYPTTVFKFDFKTKKSTIHFQPEIDFNPKEYTTKQIFYKSKDGTMIPMYVTHKTGLKMDGNNPTLLYGYGGFDISILPSFSVSNIILLENYGIYAVANIRGGGEYGEEWHTAGTQLNKQNVFDDFIYAAEFLINNKFTSSQKLAISGRSNGGLLVGACMTQRPELFKVALPAVGVLDMLRYHKFTIGWAWASDYGTSADPKHFKNLMKYSPLHNLRAASYPATLISTADHDDRVVPAHSFKFAAKLQEMHTGTNPVLIRIETNAGHGAGKPTSMKIKEAADVWSFVFHNLNVRPRY